MRQIILLLVFSLIISCNQLNKSKKTEKETVEEIIIPEAILGKDLEGNEILVGSVSYAQMKKFTNTWFKPEYNFYKVNGERLAQIKPLLDNKNVVLIMGTWCEDSQREVPGMMKILDQAGYDTTSMKIIAVDEDKRTKNGIEERYAPSYVPALIFFEGENEINRIVEFPINTLEQDILDILSGKDYKNAYAE